MSNATLQDKRKINFPFLGLTLSTLNKNHLKQHDVILSFGFFRGFRGVAAS
ncbi:hypothetical protein [Type-E symbiont of Plautia stali]|uniref:hypothetical protein n=1 Tax=Type-E symbiont of Plautia stali TaxID=1560357 RepID=UPI001428996D|nr:hypothetical protein [Type-E symbiont of Plautia stali]